ncbi:radical SAM protein [Patescibacteria group bacterium]|nr:radical SAM protein [Patescibacteria group bacterium]MBU0879705.1 radical SAM protein [Patescibacteria group bacterium]MBU0880136.1 radical SAM protein [Patescibacteria group bacterium]MBU0897646.1 radical SAM protein [Patescibacteria group bacterium]MBU1783327.1 radical SAM protein [Patescibacteria group bacterium]
MGYASGLGFSWGMVTNGTLITPEIVHKMKEAKMSTISVSLDGLENNHNWLRNSKNAFEKTINGIKLLVSSKNFNIIEIITCVNQNNINELEDIYELCNKLGVDKWRIFIISPIGRANGNSKLFLNGQQLLYLLEYIKDKRKEKKNKLSVSFCDEGFLGLEYENEVRNQLFYCWAGIRVGSVLYNGDIAACPILPREYTRQGNVKQDRFSEIWNNKYELFRNRDWHKCGDCKNCFWWEFCEGNSLHLWNFNDNKLTLCNYNLVNQERLSQKKKGKKYV